MGKLLLILVVCGLILAVWTVLVAPDYDLDPVTVQSKQLAATFALVVAAVAAILWRILALHPELRSNADRNPSEPCLIDLTCARIC